MSGISNFSGTLVPDSENSGGGSIYFSGSGDAGGTTSPGNNTYSVTFNVGQYIPAGIYRLMSFQVSDRFGRTTSLSVSGGGDATTYSNSTREIIKVNVVRDVEISGGTDAFDP